MPTATHIAHFIMEMNQETFQFYSLYSKTQNALQLEKNDGKIISLFYYWNILFYLWNI